MKVWEPNKVKRSHFQLNEAWNQLHQQRFAAADKQGGPESEEGDKQGGPESEEGDKQGGHDQPEEEIKQNNFSQLVETQIKVPTSGEESDSNYIVQSPQRGKPCKGVVGQQLKPKYTRNIRVFLVEDNYTDRVLTDFMLVNELGV